MLASNTIMVAQADALLKATPLEQRTDFKPAGCGKQLALIEQTVKLEKEISQVQTQYKDAEENNGSYLLNLVVAKGCLTELLGNDAVQSYITCHEYEILEDFELVVNTVSMERRCSSNWRLMANSRSARTATTNPRLNTRTPISKMTPKPKTKKANPPPCRKPR